MHPLNIHAAFHNDGVATTELVAHLVGLDCLDLAYFLVVDAKDRPTQRWLARRIRERELDWAAVGKAAPSNRHVRKARRAADWVKWRATSRILTQHDLRRLWRDVSRALAVARPEQRIGLARHFYQTCDAVSCEFLADALGWEPSEARSRLGVNCFVG